MAEHYGTREDADTYHLARNNTAWGSASDETRDAALVRGSQGLDALYGARYPGEVADAAQPLLWPRTGAVYRSQTLDDDAIPLPIVRAAYELALRELVSPGSLAPGVAAGPQKVLTEVKGIKWSVVGGTGAVRAVLPIVDGIVDELLIAAPTGTTVTSLARF